MKKRYTLILLLITLIVLYSTLKDNYKDTMNLLLNIDIKWLFVGFLMVFGYIFFKTIIYHTMINFFKEYSFFKAIRLQFITFFFNAATPFSSGGQPFIIFELKKEGIKINTGTTIITQGTIINQIAVLIIIFITLLLNKIYKIYPMTSILATTLTIGIIVNGLVLLIGALVSYNKKLGKKIINKIVSFLYLMKIIKSKDKTIQKWSESIDCFILSSRLLLKNKLQFMKLIGLNILSYISIYLVPLVILFGFHDYEAFDGITSIVLTSFTGMVSSYIPLPGGSGGQEVTFALLFSRYISKPMLSSIIILWRFMTYYLPMIIGSIMFNLNGGKKCE